jgi:hypothetical protein
MDVTSLKFTVSSYPGEHCGLRTMVGTKACGSNLDIAATHLWYFVAPPGLVATGAQIAFAQVNGVSSKL